jgi:hypothetical protein
VAKFFESRRKLCAVTAGVAVVAVLAVWTAPARGTIDDACSLIKSTRLAVVLKLRWAVATGGKLVQPSPANTTGVLHSSCVGIAWSGTQPAGRAAALRHLRNGTGAEFAIETWAPDPASGQYQASWTSGSYAASLGLAFVSAHIFWIQTFASRPSPQPLELPPLAGHNVTALSWSPTPGVAAVGGVWSSDADHAIVDIELAESPKRPLAKNLAKTASIAIANFGL